VPGRHADPGRSEPGCDRQRSDRGQGSRVGRAGPTASSAGGSWARSGSRRPDPPCTWPPAGRPGRRPRGDPDRRRAWSPAASLGQVRPRHPEVRTAAPPWAWSGRRHPANRRQRHAWLPWGPPNCGRREPGRPVRSRAGWPGDLAPARPPTAVRPRAIPAAARPAASPARAPASGPAPGAHADAAPASRSRRPPSRWPSYLVPRANHRHHSSRLHIRTPHPSHSPPTQVRKGSAWPGAPEDQLTAGRRRDRPPGWQPGPVSPPGQPDGRSARWVRSIELLKHSFESLEIGSNEQVSLFDTGPPGARLGGPALPGSPRTGAEPDPP